MQVQRYFQQANMIVSFPFCRPFDGSSLPFEKRPQTLTWPMDSPPLGLLPSPPVSLWTMTDHDLWFSFLYASVLPQFLKCSMVSLATGLLHMLFPLLEILIFFDLIKYYSHFILQSPFVFLRESVHPWLTQNFFAGLSQTCSSFMALNRWSFYISFCDYLSPEFSTGPKFYHILSIQHTTSLL